MLALIDPFAHPKTRSWKLEGVNEDCCSWEGVECNEDTGHMIGLDLSSSCLYGSILPWSPTAAFYALFNFKGLILLITTSTSPRCRLSRLTYLNLSNSLFSGNIPSKFSDLSKLTSLDLSYNSRLHLRSLKDLVQNLTGLKDLRLRVTFNEDLAGSLPEFYFSSPLKILWLWDTAFSGKLPASIGNLDSLKELYIGVGNFWGSTPPSIVNFPWLQLQILDLRFNKLQALPQIPPPATTVYLVANNMIQEQIPSQICSLSSLYSIDLSNNKFRGILPDCLRNFSSSLSILNLRGNIFHGVIPQLCAKGSIIKMTDLSQNQFTGILPRSLSNCGMLEILNLGSNQLKDVFPSWLGTLPELSVLILRHNGFHGVVGSPTTMFEAPKLHILDLSATKFTGKLPFKYFRNWKFVKDDTNNFTQMRAFRLIPLAGFSCMNITLTQW
uniref:Leucine-rich repeat-containing N-terminal plant-type domain-containing protein n=1 Tax=Quercus lobata TaxID=97700 RepID=A0A7N2L6N7_QUELO